MREVFGDIIWKGLTSPDIRVFEIEIKKFGSFEDDLHDGDGFEICTISDHSDRVFVSREIFFYECVTRCLGLAELDKVIELRRILHLVSPQ